MEEHCPDAAGVVGSNPTVPTIKDKEREDEL